MPQIIIIPFCLLSLGLSAGPLKFSPPDLSQALPSTWLSRALSRNDSQSFRRLTVRSEMLLATPSTTCDFAVEIVKDRPSVEAITRVLENPTSKFAPMSWRLRKLPRSLRGISFLLVNMFNLCLGTAICSFLSPIFLPRFPGDFCVS